MRDFWENSPWARRLTDRQLNQLALVFAGLTVLSCLCSVVTFFNPHVFFNVFEPTRLAPQVLPSITPSPLRYPTLPPQWTDTPVPSATAPQSRSEERRVGKECRSRWS